MSEKDGPPDPLVKYALQRRSSVLVELDRRDTPVLTPIDSERVPAGQWPPAYGAARTTKPAHRPSWRKWRPIALLVGTLLAVGVAIALLT